MSDHIIYLIKVIVICFGSALLIQIVSSNLIKKLKKLDEKKQKTLITVIHSVTNYVALFAAIILAISPYLDITKLLAGAGVLGVVLGIGAQSIIRDMLSGFFFLYEKQLHAGDMITVNGKYTGTVDEVGLRVLKIRENNGRMLTIANGEIKEIENFNKESMMIVEKPVISYRENPEVVFAILENVCVKLNDTYHEQLIEPFKMAGMGSLQNHTTGFEYVVLAKVQEKEYFAIQAAARKEIAMALYTSKIRLAESQHHYKTIVEHAK